MDISTRLKESPAGLVRSLCSSVHSNKVSPLEANSLSPGPERHGKPSCTHPGTAAVGPALWAPRPPLEGGSPDPLERLLVRWSPQHSSSQPLGSQSPASLLDVKFRGRTGRLHPVSPSTIKASVIFFPSISFFIIIGKMGLD